MKNCTHYQSMIVNALYGDLSEDQQADFDTHRAACADCHAEFSKLQETLRIMDKRDHQEPTEEFLDNLWDKVEQGLDAKPGNLIPFVPAGRQWLAKAAAVAAVLIVGIMIGRVWQANDYSGMQLSFHQEWQGQPIENDDQLAVRTRAYLERSRIILLGLVNLEDNSDMINTLDISAQAAASGQLVEEARILKEALSRHEDRKIHQLVADLEILLMQIANLEKTEQSEGLALLRQGVERHSIMLKLDLEATRSKNNRQVSKKPLEI